MPVSPGGGRSTCPAVSWGRMGRGEGVEPSSSRKLEQAFTHRAVRVFSGGASRAAAALSRQVAVGLSLALWRGPVHLSRLPSIPLLPPEIIANARGKMPRTWWEFCIERHIRGTGKTRLTVGIPLHPPVVSTEVGRMLEAAWNCAAPKISSQKSFWTSWSF